MFSTKENLCAGVVLVIDSIVFDTINWMRLPCASVTSAVHCTNNSTSATEYCPNLISCPYVYYLKAKLPHQATFSAISTAKFGLVSLTML